MKKLILCICIILQSCASHKDHYVYDLAKVVEKMPEVDSKLEVDFLRCKKHIEQKKIKTNLNTDKKNEAFCGCILFGFMKIHNFVPFNESFDDYRKRSLEYNEDRVIYIYKSVMSEQDEFNNYDAAINSMVLNKKKYNEFISKYEKKINFCASNADLGLATFL